MVAKTIDKGKATIPVKWKLLPTGTKTNPGSVN